MSSQVSQENELTYEQVIQHLANNPILPRLTQIQFHDYFPESQSVPQALTYNLNSETRVIRKIESGNNLAHTLFRGFYFQLLKLCYEMFDDQNQKNYIQILKSIIFDKALLQNQQSQKYLKYFSEFFILMQNEDEEEYAMFQEIVGQYPQIDEAFLHVLSFILESQSQIEQESEIQAILNQLCDFFEIGLIANHPFYKFQESDIYLFVDGDSSVYIVYNQQQIKEISHISSSKQSQKKQTSSLSKEDSSDIPNNNTNTEKTQNEPSHFNQSGHRQAQNRYQQKVQAIPRPFSKNSSKSSKRDQKQAQQVANRQLQTPSYQNNFKQATVKASKPYQPTYASPKIDLNNYYSPSPTKDNEIKYSFPSSQRKKDQNSGPYSASSYYDGIYGDIPHNTSTHLNSSKNDTIINIFGDMLKSGKFQNSLSDEVVRSKKAAQQTQKILESQQQFQQPNPSDVYPNFKKINKVDMTHMIDQAKSVKSVNQHISQANSVSIVVSKINEQNINERIESQNWNKWNRPIEPQVEKTIEKQSKREQSYKSYENVQEQRQIVNFDDEDSIFYKPKKSQLRVINQVTASKETITHKNSDKSDETKGSIYRQFSDTKILKLLKQPYKTKVQLMRNRFKGQHFNL